MGSIVSSRSRIQSEIESGAPRTENVPASHVAAVEGMEGRGMGGGLLGKRSAAVADTAQSGPDAIVQHSSGPVVSTIPLLLLHC